MKAKTKIKSKRIKADLAWSFLGINLFPGWTVKRSTKTIKRLVEATGIPEDYSTVVAWFTERLILVAICIAVTSFSLGVLFDIYLSPPIAESQTYNLLTVKADKASEGLKNYTQQIVDIASPLFSRLISDNREDIDQKQLTERKEKIKKYLLSKNSPFAKDDKALTAFAQSKNMKLMLAISFVESTFGQHCYYFNCSGIGGTPPNLRKYNSYAEWIQDFDQLLEARYKNLPVERFIGLYVQPGSKNWLYGVKQVLKELDSVS